MMQLLPRLAAVLLIVLASLSASAQSRPGQAPIQAQGPLRVHPTNPRYFTDGTKNADGTLRAVYLTGAHTWNNLVDIGPGEAPPAFDYGAYLDSLQRHHHNFIRLWAMEEVAWETKPRSGVPVRSTIAPHPWARTGPGLALDGKPKFDLSQFNPAYFERLRSRVVEAGRRGVYTAVMLFQGNFQQSGTKMWPDHPFHPDNNVNRINGDADGDGRGMDVHTLATPAVTRLQEAYVRRVIENVGDLDNVLYEISNESGTYSTEWQYHMIRFIKEAEFKRLKQHPVGMTFQYSPNSKLKGTNQLLLDSPADWISPNQLAGQWNYKTNPPPADGQKVIVPDTDHLGGIWGNVDWVWKCFTRGHNPILMDPYDEKVLGGNGSPVWESIRRAMGVTRQLAHRTNMATMTPQGDLASTSYCLAEPGTAYVIYLPAGGEVTVDLTGGTGNFQVEWFAPVDGTVTPGSGVTGGAKHQFTAPTKGPAVLLLSKAN